VASGITFWGRRGDSDTLAALAFLRAHGYRADRVRDLDADPPRGGELESVRNGVGGWPALVAEGAGPMPDDGVDAWLGADPRRLRAPVLLTPKGALVGFGERRWAAFLDIGKSRS